MTTLHTHRTGYCDDIAMYLLDCMFSKPPTTPATNTPSINNLQLLFSTRWYHIQTQPPLPHAHPALHLRCKVSFTGQPIQVPTDPAKSAAVTVRPALQSTAPTFQQPAADVQHNCHTHHLDNVSTAPTLQQPAAQLPHIIGCHNPEHSFLAIAIVLSNG